MRPTRRCDGGVRAVTLGLNASANRNKARSKAGLSIFGRIFSNQLYHSTLARSGGDTSQLSPFSVLFAVHVRPPEPVSQAEMLTAWDGAVGHFQC